jgi:hypothetical protein
MADMGAELPIRSNEERPLPSTATPPRKVRLGSESAANLVAAKVRLPPITRPKAASPLLLRPRVE